MIPDLKTYALKVELVLIKLLVALILPSLVYSQTTLSDVDGINNYQLALESLKSGKYVSAVTYYHGALSDHIQEPLPEEILLQVYLGLGSVYYHMGNLDQATKFTLIGKDLAQSRLGKNSPEYALFINNLSIFLYEKRDLQKSLEFDKTSIEILETYGGKQENIAVALNNLAISLEIIGEYDQAIRSITKAIEYQKKVKNIDNQAIARSNSNLGSLFTNTGRNHSAIESYLSSLNLLRKEIERGKPIKLERLITINQRLAENYIMLDSFKKASIFLHEALKLQPSSESFRKYFSFELAASLLLKQGDHANAIQYGNRAIQFGQIAFSKFDKHPNLARQYTHLGEIYQANNQLDSAIHYFHEAFLYLAHGFEDHNIHANPSAAQCFREFKVIRSLRGKAQALYLRYQAAKDVRDLKTSLETYELTHDFIKKLKEDITTMGSKQRLAGDALEIYEEAIRVAVALQEVTGDQQYFEKALFFAESNKAILLLESINERMAQSASGIPDSLLDKEKQFRVDISYYEREINEENNKKNDEPDQNKIQQWEDKLYTLRREYQQLIDQFEEEYPKYYRLKYDTQLATLQDIREGMIDRKTAFLEYFVGIKKIYLFEITKQDFRIHQLVKSDDFEENIRVIQRLAKKPQLSTEEIPDFQKRIFSIYKQYVASGVENLSPRVQRLMIVPDDLLNLIPFELLSSSTDRTDFLIKEYTIGYAYSASLFKATRKPGERVADQLFLGYAPAFSAPIAENRSCAGDRLANLEYSKREVEGIQTLLGGDIMLDTEANRDSFLAQAGHYRIIHLATHACMDQENPMQSKVFFADEPMVNQDLFNLDLSADLAVLSACNTGNGQLVKGDGVLSLSKGFVHAGCPSAVMSLWSVDDFSTSEIMIAFYDYLKRGYRKDRALRQAKLDFIAAADKVKKHPFFWAAFVQMGDPVALDLGQVGIPWKIGLIIATIALLGGLFLTRRTAKAKA